MTVKIKLNAASGGGSVSLKAPSTTTGNAAVELQLPIADGTNGQVIKTNGSGVLSFGADTGGKILQVVSTTETAASQVTMAGSGENTLLSRTYTPTVSSSNALIQVSLHLDIDGAYGGMFIRLLRDTTTVSQGDAAGIRRQATIVPDFSNTTFGGALQSFTILDTGISGTSQVTYKVNIFDQSSGGGTFYFNAGRDTNNVEYNLRSVSTLTVMEVAA